MLLIELFANFLAFDVGERKKEDYVASEPFAKGGSLRDLEEVLDAGLHLLRVGKAVPLLKGWKSELGKQDWHSSTLAFCASTRTDTSRSS